MSTLLPEKASSPHREYQRPSRDPAACPSMAVGVQDSFSACSPLSSPVTLKRRGLAPRVRPPHSITCSQGVPLRAQTCSTAPHHLLASSALSRGLKPLHPPASALHHPACPAQGPGSPALAAPSGSLQGPSPLGLLPRTGWLMLLPTSSGFLWSLALVPTIHITLAHLNCVL